MYAGTENPNNKTNGNNSTTKYITANGNTAKNANKNLYVIFTIETKNAFLSVPDTVL